MSEYNQLVGVDTNSNLPDTVRDRIFESRESGVFKSGIISDAKKIIHSSVDSLESDLSSKIATLSSSKMDKPNGGLIGQTLRHDGQRAVWETVKNPIPEGGSKGQVLTRDSNGGIRWTTPMNIQNTTWSKDQQAKAQGFWIVNSTEPPAEATYTTADGHTVPVIWHQPIESLIPALPTRPYFYPSSNTIGLEKTIGFDYYLESYEKDGVTVPVNRKLVPGENSLEGIAALPYTIKIVIKPRPGYKLPSDYQWIMYYHNPETKVLLGTETFDSRPEGSMVFNTKFGDSETYWRTSAPRPIIPDYPLNESHPDYIKGISENDSASNLFIVRSGNLLIGPNTRWQAVGVKTASPRMTVTIDFTKIPIKHASWSLNIGGNYELIRGLTVYFAGDGSGITYRSSGNSGQFEFRTEPGVYKFSLIESRFEVVIPSGETFTASIDRTAGEAANQYGDFFGIRSSISARDGIEGLINSIAIENYGV